MAATMAANRPLSPGVARLRPDLLQRGTTGRPHDRRRGARDPFGAVGLPRHRCCRHHDHTRRQSSNPRIDCRAADAPRSNALANTLSSASLGKGHPTPRSAVHLSRYQSDGICGPHGAGRHPDARRYRPRDYRLSPKTTPSPLTRRRDLREMIGWRGVCPVCRLYPDVPLLDPRPSRP